MGKITAWSPSRLFDYEKCPAYAGYKYVAKLPEPPWDGEGESPLDRGTRIHKEAEEYVLGVTAKVPKDLARVQVLLKDLRKAFRKGEVKLELELAIRRDWTVCGWFDNDVYARFKMDVLRALEDGRSQITDWKSGRYRPGDPQYADQLNAYAVAALSAGFGDETEARLVFTDTGDVVPPCGQPSTAGRLKRQFLEPAQKGWDARASRMLADDVFAPRPNYSCRWCAFSKRKGGPCPF